MTETLLGNIKGPKGDKGDKGDYAIVDSALSSTSTNPVQNKVINTALSNKADSNHTHTPTLSINSTAISSVTFYKQNGWVMVDITSVSTSTVNTWVNLGSIPFSNSSGKDIYGILSNGTSVARVCVGSNNTLLVYIPVAVYGQIHGQIMYPTSE